MTARIYSFADRAARPQHGQAARLPRNTRQGAGVETGSIATRDADTRKGSGVPLNVEGRAVLPPPLPSSLVAAIANAPTITLDGRQVFLCCGGRCWNDGLGWRYLNQHTTHPVDITNPAICQALDARASS